MCPSYRRRHAHAVDTSRDLGVMVDSRLTMADQVAAICREAHYQLRQLRFVTRSLSPEAAKTVVQAFITSHLDYCNSLLYGITDNLFRRLQSVQNTAARFISGARRSDHITPVLRQLHWLPVRQRVQYKLTFLVYKSLRGLTPLYLSEECQLATVGGRRELRSADVITCHVPRTQTKLGDRAFQVAGPRLWNSVPPSMRLPDIGPNEFKRLLKTHLFV